MNCDAFGIGSGLRTVFCLVVPRRITNLPDLCADRHVEIIKDDIVSISSIAPQAVGLISCCGDTISHFDTFESLDKLLSGCYDTLISEGKFILTFRDYTHELTGNQRFIPVKNDDDRILTCIIEYAKDSLKITDLLHRKENDIWIQKVSSYNKLRIKTGFIAEKVQEAGFSILHNSTINGMIHLILQKL